MVMQVGLHGWGLEALTMRALRSYWVDERRAGTGPGHLFPDDSAYTTAALVGIGAIAITTLTSLALARRRSSETNP
jgi:hypothetical protein